MSDYTPSRIEKRWQAEWRKAKAYRVEIDPAKPKYYVLDMFPYPSGAGLHVGHPLGYMPPTLWRGTKRYAGITCCTPWGSMRLACPPSSMPSRRASTPDETTRVNIRRYKEQLDNLGFGYDWDLDWETDPAKREGRELRTSDPGLLQMDAVDLPEAFSSLL